MTLASMEPGQTGRIISIEAMDESLVRLAELGLITGERVKLLKRAPLGDPIEIRIMNYNLCLRKKEASCIEVQLLEE